MKTWDDVMKDIRQRAEQPGLAIVVANGPEAFGMMASRAPDAVARSVRMDLRFPSGFRVVLRRYRRAGDEPFLRGYRADVVFVSTDIRGDDYFRHVVTHAQRDISASPSIFHG
jgi:hypothetical protein